MIQIDLTTICDFIWNFWCFFTYVNVLWAYIIYVSNNLEVSKWASPACFDPILFDPL